MRYRFVHAHQAEHRLTRLCQTLSVSRSGYYAWRRRPASARTRANAQLLEHLQRLHRQTKARYGAVKMWHALLAAGIACGRHRVARLRRAHGLEARRTRRFRVVVEQHQFAPPAPNRLHQVFVAPAVNRIWVGDLTAIATRSGWLYLAVLLDLYSRRVIGWAMSAKPDQHLALEALRMALVSRRPHQDPSLTTGATTFAAYQQRLAEHGIAASMSRKGNCYDNAVAESFFSTLKNDLVHERDYHTREDARAEIFEFIEVFYNRQRLHQTLGYVSPEQFETQNPVPLPGCLRNPG
jgi:transposase InsO family protein